MGIHDEELSRFFLEELKGLSGFRTTKDFIFDMEILIEKFKQTIITKEQDFTSEDPIRILISMKALIEFILDKIFNVSLKNPEDTKSEDERWEEYKDILKEIRRKELKAFPPMQKSPLLVDLEEIIGDKEKAKEIYGMFIAHKKLYAVLPE